MFGSREVALNVENPAAWITLTEAKAFLGVTGTEQDSRISTLLTVAASQVESYIGSIVSQRTVTERIYAEDYVTALTVTHYPVISLTSLTVDDEAQTLGEFRVANAQGIIRRVDGYAVSGREVVAVYTAGYANAAAVPPAIVEATKHLVKDLYNATGRDFSISKESVPDVGSVEYRDGETYFRSNGVAVSAEIAALLAPFVKRGL